MLWIIALITAVAGAASGSVWALMRAQSRSERRLVEHVMTLVSALAQGMVPYSVGSSGLLVGPLRVAQRPMTLRAALLSADEGFTLDVELALERPELSWLALEVPSLADAASAWATLHVASDAWRARLGAVLAALLDEPSHALMLALGPGLIQASGRPLDLALRGDTLRLRARFEWSADADADAARRRHDAMLSLLNALARLAQALADALPQTPWAAWTAIFYQSWEDPQAQATALRVLMAQCPERPQTRAAFELALAQSEPWVVLTCARADQLEPALDALSLSRLLELLAAAQSFSSSWATSAGAAAPLTGPLSLPAGEPCARVVALLRAKASERLERSLAQAQPSQISPAAAMAVLELWIAQPARRPALAALCARCWGAWSAPARVRALELMAAHPSPAWIEPLALMLEGFWADAQAQALLSIIASCALIEPSLWRLQALQAGLETLWPRATPELARRLAPQLARDAPAAVLGGLTRALGSPQRWAHAQARVILDEAAQALRAQRAEAGLGGAVSVVDDACAGQLSSVGDPRGQLALTSSLEVADGPSPWASEDALASASRERPS